MMASLTIRLLTRLVTKLTESAACGWPGSQSQTRWIWGSNVSGAVGSHIHRVAGEELQVKRGDLPTAALLLLGRSVVQTLLACWPAELEESSALWSVGRCRTDLVGGPDQELSRASGLRRWLEGLARLDSLLKVYRSIL
jgi:hypothetical protein